MHMAKMTMRSLRKMISEALDRPPNLKVITGSHVLFVGGNGTKTAGITVQHIDAERAKREGLRVTFDVNLYSLKRSPKLWLDELGIPVEQLESMVSDLTKLEA